MDKRDRRTILEYIDQHPADNSDLFTLWYKIGNKAFLKAVQDADGRRIILQQRPADKHKCDPPIYWRYRAKSQ